MLTVYRVSGGGALSAVRSVWRQCRMPALRGAHLRGLQGLLQAHRSEERQVRVSGGQELPGGQAAAQPVPVLPVPEVPDRRDGEGGGEDGQSQGPEGPAAHQTAEPAGPHLHPARRSNHRSCPCSHRLHAET